jgi:methylated-DNA-[protein]-cysteine S-methyltransferase
MSILNYSTLNSFIGEIFVVSTEEGVAKVIFGEERFWEFKSNLNGHMLIKGGQAEKSAEELELYLLGKLKKFEIKPDIAHGNLFQIKVWKKLLKVPYGWVITYGELAREIGKPNAARAVGNAVGSNPIPIIVPCHRVVASNGIGGYSSGIEIKKILLKIEGAIS